MSRITAIGRSGTHPWGQPLPQLVPPSFEQEPPESLPAPWEVPPPPSLEPGPQVRGGPVWFLLGVNI